MQFTWGRADGFQRAVFTGLAYPWRTGDLKAALGIAFSPQLLDSPDVGALVEQLLPLFRAPRPESPPAPSSCRPLGVERAEEYLPLVLALPTRHSFTQA